jgi:hypothetical protein
MLLLLSSNNVKIALFINCCRDAAKLAEGRMFYEEKAQSSQQKCAELMIQYDQWKMLKNTVFRSDRIPDE